MTVVATMQTFAFDQKISHYLAHPADLPISDIERATKRVRSMREHIVSRWASISEKDKQLLRIALAGDSPEAGARGPLSSMFSAITSGIAFAIHREHALSFCNAVHDLVEAVRTKIGEDAELEIQENPGMRSAISSGFEEIAKGNFIELP